MKYFNELFCEIITCAKCSFDTTKKLIQPGLKLGTKHGTTATIIVLSAHGATIWVKCTTARGLLVQITVGAALFLGTQYHHKVFSNLQIKNRIQNAQLTIKQWGCPLDVSQILVMGCKKPDKKKQPILVLCSIK